jgi:hypothetical protein
MRRRSVMIASLVAALLLGITAVYWAAHDQQRGPVEAHVLRLGVADPDLRFETAAVQASQLAAMKAIGLTSVRLDANWDWVQRTGPETFSWAQLDQAVNSVRAAGMSVDLIIDGCPPWAASFGTKGDSWSQPASPKQYAAWAADVARRYGPRGVNTFEIWNEPNIVTFWQPKPNPAAYTADLIAAYSAIKAVDPSAFVISGGLANAVSNGTNYSAVDFLKAMYAEGAKGHLDAVGYHPYSFPLLPNKHGSGWFRMVQAHPSIRGVMIRNGDAAMPIWVTEFGAPSGGQGGVGEGAQATALVQAIMDAKKSRWIGALYLFTWQDTATDPSSDQDWFGLLTATGSPKAAYRAVAAAIGK